MSDDNLGRVLAGKYELVRLLGKSVQRAASSSDGLPPRF
jgi:hypothetical protein